MLDKSVENPAQRNYHYYGRAEHIARLYDCTTNNFEVTWNL